MRDIEISPRHCKPRRMGLNTMEAPKAEPENGANM
jgi:hypothetical protein